MLATSTPCQLSTFHSQVKVLLKDISYPGLQFQTYEDGEQRVHLRVHNPAGICAQTGESWAWSGRWHRLSEHMTDSEIVGTAFHAVMTALEHEAREHFTFEGVAVYDAHLSVHALAELRRDPGNLDIRRH